jgi:hypothetical protein
MIDEFSREPTRRELVESVKPHWGIAASLVAAAASTYATSAQAAAQKKSALAAANAGIAGGAHGVGGYTPTASTDKSVSGGTLGKSLVTAAGYGEPSPQHEAQPLQLQPLESAQPSPPLMDAAQSQPKPEPYNAAMGLNDAGTKDNSVKQYSDLATQALPLILALTQGHPPQAQPLQHPQPFQYTPTAFGSYRQMIGGGF